MKRIVTLGVILMTMVCTVFGQKMVDTKTYKLKPEDVLLIQVFGRAEIQGQVPIGEDGNVTPPFLSPIKAAGKTVAELKADIYSLYVKEMKLRDPIVSVTVVQYRRLKANINGQVNRPGDVFFRPGDTIMTLISSGGGAIPERADQRKATLRRVGTKELIPIDLYALQVQGDNSQNYELQDGDILDVPEEQRNRILVMGAIRQPGPILFRESMRVADAISTAGGEVRYLSRLSKTFILRELPGRPGDYIRINVDYVKFIKSGDYTQNVLLKPGDLIYVPETNTPDFAQIQSIVNTAFLFQTFGGIFGLSLGR
jgi:polysaccharide biosynthesis/export protein